MQSFIKPMALALLVATTTTVTYADDDESATTSLFYDLGKAAAGAAAKEVGGKAGAAFAGLALNKLGIGHSQPSTGQQILSELDVIEDTLNDILAELQEIDTDILVQTCDLLDAQNDPDIALISNLNNMYQAWLTPVSEGGVEPWPLCQPSEGGNLYDPTTCLQAWADTVLDPHTGVKLALEHINTVLTAEQSSSISACMKVNPPAENSTDTAWYTSQYNYLENYYSWQTIGTLQLVEAYRFYAWYNAGQPLIDVNSTDYDDPSAYNQLCTDTDTICQESGNCTMTGNSYVTTTQCEAAYSPIHLANQRITAQYQIVGAPYSNKNLLTYYRREDGNDPTSQMLGRIHPRSLDNFTQAAPGGDSCTYPLSFDSPCGVTKMVGGSQPYPSNMKVFNRTGWDIADNADWSRMAEAANVAGQGGTALGEYLSTVELQGLEDKIFFMKDWIHIVHVGQNTRPVDQRAFNLLCFADTTMHWKPSSDNPVFCKGQDDVDHLMKKRSSGSYKQDGTKYHYETMKADSDHIPTGITNSFYQGYQEFDTSKGNLYWHIDEAGSSCTETNGQCEKYDNPGYLVPHTSPHAMTPHAAFSLPTIYVEDLQCTQNYGNCRNGWNGYAFCMCGNDANKFFETVIPPPPSSQVQTAVSASALTTQGSTAGMTDDQIMDMAAQMDVSEQSSTTAPSSDPSAAPTAMASTAAPTGSPTAVPETSAPSSAPTTAPTSTPTIAPTATASTVSPTATQTSADISDSPSAAPSSVPSSSPSITTDSPSAETSGTAAPSSDEENIRYLRGGPRKM